MCDGYTATELALLDLCRLMRKRPCPRRSVKERGGRGGKV